MAGRNNVLEFILAFRDQTKVALASARAGLESLGKTLDTVAAKTALQGQAAEAAQKAQQEFVSSLAGVAVVAFGIYNVTKAYADYETALRGVGKTTGLVGKELSGIGDMFKDMSRQVPVTAKDFLDIAAVAGQLGITATEDIKKFTNVVAAMGVATNLKGEEAATALSKILNVTGGSVQDVDKLASAINALGNVSNALEDRIAYTATAVAQSTAVFGNSAKDAVIYGTAIAEMGIRAETAASSMGIAFQQIDIAAKAGGDGLKAFAELTGLTADEFQRLARESPKDAFRAFLEGLQRSIKEGNNYLPLLNKLGLGGTEASRVFQTLANNVQRLGVLQAVANKEFENPTALANEAASAYNTFSNRVQVLTNSFNVFAIEVGGVLATVFTPFLTVTKGIIDVFIELNKATGGTVAVLGAVVVGFVGLMAILPAARAALALLAAQASATWAALLGPTGLVIGGIAAVTAAVVALTFAWKPLSDAVGGVWQGFTDLIGTTSEVQRQQLKLTDASENYKRLLADLPGLRGEEREAAELQIKAAKDLLDTERERQRTLLETALIEAQAADAANRNVVVRKDRDGNPYYAEKQAPKAQAALRAFNAAAEMDDMAAAIAQFNAEREASDRRARQARIQLNEEQQKAAEEITKALIVTLDQQAHELRLIGQTEEAQARLNLQFRFEQEAKKGNIELDAAQLKMLEAALDLQDRKLESLKRQAVISKQDKPVQDFTVEARRIDSLVDSGQITAEFGRIQVAATALKQQLDNAFSATPSQRFVAERVEIQNTADTAIVAYQAAAKAKVLTVTEAEALIAEVRARAKRQLDQSVEDEKKAYRSILDAVKDIPAFEYASQVEDVRKDYEERKRIVLDFRATDLSGAILQASALRAIEAQHQKDIQNLQLGTAKAREILAGAGGALGYQTDLQNFKIAEQAKIDFLRAAYGRNDPRTKEFEAGVSRREKEYAESRAGGNVAQAVAGPDDKLKRLSEQQALEREMLAAHLQAMNATEAEALAARLALEQQHNQDRVELQTASYALAASSLSSGFEQMAGVLEEAQGKQSGIYKAMFAASKAFAIAESIVNISAAVAKASNWGIFPANLAAMGTIIAQTASIVSNIRAVKLAKGGGVGDAYAKQVQGFVRGPGGPKDDKVPAWLSNEEFVVNAAATKKHRALLEAINKNRFSGGGFVAAKPVPRFAAGGHVGRAVRRFADGGFVGRTPAPSFPASAGSGGLGSLTINVPITYHAAPGGQREGEKDSQTAGQQIGSEVRRVIVQELREQGLIRNAIRAGG